MITAEYFPTQLSTQITDGRTTIILDGKWPAILRTNKGVNAMRRALDKANAGDHTGITALHGENIRWNRTLTLMFADD